MKRTASFIFILFVFLKFAGTAYATEASLRCTPSTGTYNIGETFTIDYVLDTRGFGAYGANIVATFDSTILEGTTAQSTAVTTGTDWSQPTTNTVDNSLGKVTLDFGNTQASYSGTTTVGQLTFRTKAVGQAQFNYTFFQQYDDTTPGVAKVWGYKDQSQTLSNILTDVNNCVYVVTGNPTATPANPTATVIPAPSVSELPRAGVMDNTFRIVLVAGAFIFIGGIVPFAYINRKSS